MVAAVPLTFPDPGSGVLAPIGGEVSAHVDRLLESTLAVAADEAFVWSGIDELAWHLWSPLRQGIRNGHGGSSGPAFEQALKMGSTARQASHRNRPRTGA
jgi:hypothetical protein